MLHSLRMVYATYSHQQSKDAVTMCGTRSGAWVTDTRLRRCPTCCDLSGVPEGVGAPLLDEVSRPYLLV